MNFLRISTFNDVSNEDNVVVSFDSDATFFCSTVEDVEEAHEDFDDVEFFMAHLSPTTSPSFNKRPIEIKCYAIYDEDTTFDQHIGALIGLELKSLKGS